MQVLHLAQHQICTPSVRARSNWLCKGAGDDEAGRRQAARAARGVERLRVEGDPRSDPHGAAAQIVGVLWDSASQGPRSYARSWASLENAYEFLLGSPPLGLAVQRHSDELRLVTAPKVSSSVEHHLHQPKAVPLSNAALEGLAIVAYRQLIARSGIELIRGSPSDSAMQRCSNAGSSPAPRITCS